jgi:hypothetical protein
MNARVVARFCLICIMPFVIVGCGFAGSEVYSSYDPPGFFSGLWHGMVAPYTLVIRIFLDIKMYAIPNSGWFYDFGFLLGMVLSVPIGWFAAIVAIPCEITGFTLLPIINSFLHSLAAMLAIIIAKLFKVH